MAELFAKDSASSPRDIEHDVIRIFNVAYQRTVVEIVIVEATDEETAKGLALYGYGVPVGVPKDASKPILLTCREAATWPDSKSE